MSDHSHPVPEPVLRGEPGYVVGQAIALGAAEPVGPARQPEDGTTLPRDRADKPPAMPAEAHWGRYQADGVVRMLRAGLGPRRVPQAQVAVVGKHLEVDGHDGVVDPVAQIAA